MFEIVAVGAIAKPAALVIMCTNLAGARIAGDISAELGIPVIDSVSATLEAGLRWARASQTEGTVGA